MNPSDPSRTALATSMMRAVHSRTAPFPLLHDPWGDRLVPEVVRVMSLERTVAGLDPAAREKALADPVATLDSALKSSAAYADVVLRARYTEDALAAAVARGIDQYVIVGAGFDSFALRRPANAAHVSVLEIDHPATQSLKRKRLADCGIPASPSLHFVAADLAAESLGDALARSPFQSNRPAFFSWLGVTMYLTKEANIATLKAIAASAAPGSELVFSYVNAAVFSDKYAGTESFRKLREAVASAGEAFQSGFDPATLPSLMQTLGYDLLEDLDGNQAAARYDPEGVNALRTNRAAHIAHVRTRASS